jgi:putative nucleotidyltransferase with HDIG domain
LLSLDLNQDQSTVVSELVQRFLKPNAFYDDAATQEARASARASAASVVRNFREGQIIVREGSVILALDLEALQELGLTSHKFELWDNGDAMAFAAILLLGLALYLARLQPEVLDGGRHEILLTILLTLFLVLTRLLMPTGDLLPYLFPSAAMTMLLVVTQGRSAAIGAMLFLGGVCGWIAGDSLVFAVLTTGQGLIAALSLPRYENIGSFFRSGLLAGGAASLILLAFDLAEFNAAPVALLMKIGVCLVGGLLSGGLTIGILFLLTPLFDLTTTFRLMELSRPNHPLLQRLLREAPATFNHVMMVASLAEQAAERIGGNVLLTRVGAYYHDIGKLLRPYFFIENQQGLSNPHDRLDPYTSVDVLTGHIRDGIRLAQQYHLPERVIAFIPEHHGTMRTSFFYQKAVEAAGGDADLVDEAHFRYPGPTPRSRETALLMLADGCEAATRARRPSTPEELEGIVNGIFDQRLRDGQLDMCPITMQELHLAKMAYIELLRALSSAHQLSRTQTGQGRR